MLSSFLLTVISPIRISLDGVDDVDDVVLNDVHPLNDDPLADVNITLVMPKLYGRKGISYTNIKCHLQWIIDSFTFLFTSMDKKFTEF